MKITRKRRHVDTWARGHLSMWAYEQRYAMTSAEFYQRFCSGELGDAMDYVEWSVFWDMYQATLRRMEALTRPE